MSEDNEPMGQSNKDQDAITEVQQIAMSVLLNLDDLGKGLKKLAAEQSGEAPPKDPEGDMIDRSQKGSG